MKNLTALFLIFALTISSWVSYAEEYDSEYLVSIDFGERCITHNAEVRVGDRGGISTFSQDGVNCWKTDMSSMAMYIYINIDDKILYDEMAALEVEIEYYDDINAQFSLNYEAQDETYKYTDGIFTQGTKEWKIAKFYIDDVKLANGENGNDMRLTPFVEGKGKSKTDITFKSVKIKRVKFRNPVRMSYTFENPGGIFHDEIGNGNIHFYNIMDQAFNISGEMSVYCNNEFLYSEPIQFSIDGKGEFDLKKEFQMNMYGMYTSKIHLKDDDGYFEWTYEMIFSKTVLNDTQNRSYGTNGHYGQGKGSHDINAKLMREAGCGWVRDGANWNNIEKERGVYNFPSSITGGVDAYVKNGLEVLYMIGYCNNLYDGGKTPASEEGIAAFARYAAETARCFKGKVNCFEIWNEYNINGFNPSNEPPETYAKMLKAAYEAIKAVNPQAVIVGCATSEIDIGWIERVFAAGGYNYMDVVSIHPYTRKSPDRNELRQDIMALKEMCKKYGEEKPIWFTEDGFSSSIKHLDLYGYTDEWIAINQAKHPIADVVYDICDKVFMYDFQNDGADINNSEHNFGLIRTWGYNIDNPYSAKEGYASVAFANYFASHNTYERCIADTEDERLFLYKNNVSEEHAVVMWSTARQKRITLKLSNEINVYDLYGNKEIMRNPNGIYTFELGESMIYITGNFDNAEIADNPYRVLDNYISASQGENFIIYLERKNADERKSFKIEDENGFAANEEVTFEEGEYQKGVEIKVPSTADIGSYTLHFKDEDGTVTPLSAFFDITEPITVSDIRTGMLYKNRWDYWYTECRITNNSRSPVNGLVYFSDYVNAPEVPYKFYNLAAGETRTVKIVLSPMKEKRIANTELIVQLDNGMKVITNTQLAFLAAKKADRKPMIDGILSPGEWRTGVTLFIDDPNMAKMYTDYGGIEDLSAKAYLMWDEENLYIGADVTDNVFSQTETDKYIWRGDMIQIGLFDDVLAEDYRGQNFEIGIALTQKGTEVYQYLGLGYKIGALENAEAVVKRNGKTIVYEAKIPWKEAFNNLIEIQDGKTIKFSVLINDNDGSGRRGWLEYGSGIGAAKDASLYLDLYLAGE